MQVAQRGFSLVEVIVASAILVLFFGGLISGVKLMLDLIGHTKAETGARSLALSRMEYIRSLDYDAVGTVGGIPSGTIPQTSTSTLNGIDYTERVLVLYVDRPEDGLEAMDANGVLEDSKRIKVEYTWTIRNEVKRLALVSDMAPKGLETSAGGGSLVVHVFDAAVAPVTGASVRIFNNTIATSTIDVTVNTNSQGRVIIPGVSPGGNYEITVTKTGYSTDQTYPVTTANPNPNPPHVAVASSTITTMYFSIDVLSNLTFRAIGEPVTREFVDELVDSNLVINQTGTSVAGGGLILASSETGYVSSGNAYSTTTAPTSFSAWQSFDWTRDTPTSTTLVVRLYQESGGTFTLVNDTALPGNSAGFTNGPIDISTLATSTYQRLALGTNLTSLDASSTPRLERWTLSYIESEPPVGGIAFGVTGTKTIGIGVFKYQDTITVDSNGTKSVSLEWDAYSVSLDGVSNGYDIKEVRGILPYTLVPNLNTTLTFVLVPHLARTLHLTVTNTDGNPISGVNVRLQKTGYDVSQVTSIYGQVFFDDLSSDGPYTLTVEKTGYEIYSNTFEVTGNLMSRVNLVPII